MRIFFDTFTDIDNTKIINHLPDDGAYWSQGPFWFAEFGIKTATFIPANVLSPNVFNTILVDKGSAYVAESNNYPENHSNYEVTVKLVSSSDSFAWPALNGGGVAVSGGWLSHILARYDVDNGYYLISFGKGSGSKLELAASYFDQNHNRTIIQEITYTNPLAYTLKANGPSGALFRVRIYGEENVRIDVLVREPFTASYRHNPVEVSSINFSGPEDVVTSTTNRNYTASGTVTFNSSSDISSPEPTWFYTNSGSITLDGSSTYRLSAKGNWRDFDDGPVYSFFHNAYGTNNAKNYGKAGIGQGKFPGIITANATPVMGFDNFTIDEFFGAVGVGGVEFSGTADVYATAFTHVFSGSVNFEGESSFVSPVWTWNLTSSLIGSINFSESAYSYLTVIGLRRVYSSGSINFSEDSIQVANYNPIVEDASIEFIDALTEYGYSTGSDFYYTCNGGIVFDGELYLNIPYSTSGDVTFSGSASASTGLFNFIFDGEVIFNGDSGITQPESIIFFDTLRDVNGTYLLSHIPEVGVGWDYLYSDGVEFTILNNEAVVQSGSDRGVAYLADSINYPSHEGYTISVDFKPPYPAPNTDCPFYLFARQNFSNSGKEYGYVLSCEVGLSDYSLILKVVDITGFVNQQLAAIFISRDGTITEPFSLIFRVYGQELVKIEVYLRDQFGFVKAIDFIDDVIICSDGKVGIGSGSFISSPLSNSSNQRFDNFKILEFMGSVASGGITFSGDSTYISSGWSYVGSGYFSLGDSAFVALSGYTYITSLKLKFIGEINLSGGIQEDEIFVSDRIYSVEPVAFELSGQSSVVSPYWEWEVDPSNKIEFNGESDLSVRRRYRLGDISGGITFSGNSDYNQYGYTTSGSITFNSSAVVNQIEYRHFSPNSGRVRFRSNSLPRKYGFKYYQTGGILFTEDTTAIISNLNYKFTTSGEASFIGPFTIPNIVGSSGGIVFSGGYTQSIIVTESFSGFPVFTGESVVQVNYFNTIAEVVNLGFSGGILDGSFQKIYKYETNPLYCSIRFSLYTSAADITLSTKHYLYTTTNFNTIRFSLYESSAEAYISKIHRLYDSNALVRFSLYESKSEYSKFIPKTHTASGGIVFSGYVDVARSTVTYNVNATVKFIPTTNSFISYKSYIPSTTGRVIFSGSAISYIRQTGPIFSGSAIVTWSEIVRQSSWYGSADVKLGYRFENNGSVEFISTDIVIQNAKFNYDFSFNWNIDVPINIDHTFEWNVGPLTYYWYHIEGQCLPTTCQVGDFSYTDNNQDCGCDLISFDLQDSQCGQSVVIKDLIATSTGDVCRQLKEQGFFWPLHKIRRYSIPANELIGEGVCNVLEEVEFCNAPECLEYCLDLDANIKIGISVIVDIIYFNYEIIGEQSFSGTSISYIVPEKFYLEGSFSISGSAEYSVTMDTWSFESLGSIELLPSSNIVSSYWNYNSEGLIEINPEFFVVFPDQNYESDGKLNFSGNCSYGINLIFVSDGTADNPPSNAGIVFVPSFASDQNAFNFIESGSYIITGESYITCSDAVFENEVLFNISGSLFGVISSAWSYQSTGSIDFSGNVNAYIGFSSSGTCQFGGISDVSSSYKVESEIASVTFTPETELVSSAYSWLGETILQFTSGSESSSSNLEVFDEITVGMVVDLVDFQVLFGETYGNELLASPALIDVGCDCPSTTNLLNINQNIFRNNKFDNFIRRNKFVVNNQFNMLYNSTNMLWQKNFHFVGISDSNKMEKWNIVFDWQCKNSSDSSYAWRLGVVASQMDLLTFANLETRILIEFPSVLACYMNSLNIGININTKTKKVSTTNNVVANKLIIYDNIGLFKSSYWQKYPEIKFQVSATVLNPDENSLDIGQLLTIQ